MFAPVASICLSDVRPVPVFQDIETITAFPPFETICQAQDLIDDISQRHLDRLQWEMETLSDSGIPQVKFLRPVWVEAPCKLIGSPAIRGHRPVESK
jgi:hypothetical protein